MTQQSLIPMGTKVIKMPIHPRSYLGRILRQRRIMNRAPTMLEPEPLMKELTLAIKEASRYLLRYS